MLSEDRQRQKDWAAFQASLAAEEAREEGAKREVKMVEIEKRYRFAGKDIVCVYFTSENLRQLT